MRITKKQLRRVIKEELHRSTSRRAGRKIPHGWSQILPWLTEDSVDDELEHLRSNIEDDKEHIDNLEDDIKDEREEEEHAHEIERHHHHESHRKQWGTDPLNLAELSAPFTQDYVDEEGEFDTDAQDTWFSTGAENARLYGEADEDEGEEEGEEFCPDPAETYDPTTGVCEGLTIGMQSDPISALTRMLENAEDFAAAAGMGQLEGLDIKSAARFEGALGDAAEALELALIIFETPGEGDYEPIGAPRSQRQPPSGDWS